MNPRAPLLLVDNSDDDVELFQMGLARAGLPNPVQVCRDGVAALDYLLRRGDHAQRCDPLPILVLMDMKMPRLDGTDVLARMRELPALASIPVVIMSSSSHQRDIKAAYAAGANGFVVKPVDFDRLMETAAAIGRFWGEFNHVPDPGPH